MNTKDLQIFEGLFGFVGEYMKIEYSPMNLKKKRYLS